jgi:hypothetical protein
MKKGLKSCLIVVVVLVGLGVAGLAAMFFAKLCPPQGPWPMPPWCGEGMALPTIPENLPSLMGTQAAAPFVPTPTPLIYQLPPDDAQVFSSPEWEQNPILPASFMLGNTLMDVYGNEQYQQYLNSTLDSMKNTGAGWVVFDNYWSYQSLEPPIVGPFPNRFGFRDATADEIQNMVDEAHARGLKFALMMELNWDVMAGPWVSWEESQKFWTESQQFLTEKAEDVNGNAAYWDAWFETYTAFALDQAATAEKSGADMLVIGKQIDGAVAQGNQERWQALIEQVHRIYHGPLSYAAYTNQYGSHADVFPFQDLDYITIYLYNDISDADQPTLEELKASFEHFNQTQFEPLSRKYGKPVIFLTPFQSRDHGARQEWFEPSGPAPEVGQDLLIQAMMYEALFQSIQGQDWVAGVWTWGYWWRDDFTNHEPGDASFEKSSTVRNKPAMWIIQKWAGGIGKTP